jgi:outer membrane protein assembly factor BamB
MEKRMPISRPWVFWTGCVVLGGFVAIAALIWLSGDSAVVDEDELARFQKSLSRPAPTSDVDAKTLEVVQKILDAKKTGADVDALLDKAAVASLTRYVETRLAARKELDWPGWRGPRRDGHSRETGLHLDWRDEEPPVLWRVKIGDGFGSMAVAAGRVYTQFQADQQEVAGCWDAQTGTELWRHEYDAIFKDRFGAGPRSTPVVAGDAVFTVGATGILHCLDAAKGKVRWRKDLCEAFNVGLPAWAFAFSPLVVGDLVLIVPGGTQGNAIAALDRSDGRIIWKHLDVGGGYSSPILAELSGQRQAIFFTAFGLVSVVPETGRELWRHEWRTDHDANIATPIVIQDYVFISSGYNAGCALIRVAKGEDKWTVSEVYRHKRMQNHFSSSIYHNGYIYGAHEAGNLVCLKMTAPTERARWVERDFGRANLILVDEHLIVFGENGLLAVAQATPVNFAEKGRMQLFDQRLCWSAPALADGRLYVRDRREMVCLDLRKK